jgi:hypothetical protein
MNDFLNINNSSILGWGYNSLFLFFGVSSVFAKSIAIKR